MANNKKEYKTTKTMLRSGAILQGYGSKALLSVCPEPEIEKVRFSIVKLGTKGKDVLNFYLSIEDMRLFCQEIDRGIAERRIASDNGNYPGAYKYVTGENGRKRLNIGGGRAGVRVQIQETGNGGIQQQMMTVIQIKDLYTMSFYYKLVMGLVPAYAFYNGLVEEFWNGVEDRKKFHSKDNEFNPQEDGDYIPPFVEDDIPEQNNSEDPALQEASPESKSQVENNGNSEKSSASGNEANAPEPDAPVQAANNENKADDANTANTASASDDTNNKGMKPKVMRFTTTNTVSLIHAGALYPAKGEDGKDYKLLFRHKTVRMLGDTYQDFALKAKNQSVTATISYYQKDETAYVVGFA